MLFKKPNFPYNKQLDDEFRQLGFENGAEIFTTKEYLASKMIFETVVPVTNAWILGYDRVIFQFLVHEPTTQHPNYILCLSASTGRPGNGPLTREPSVTLSGGLDEPGSSKQELIERIYEKEWVNFKHYKAAYMLLMMGKKAKLNTFQETVSQKSRVHWVKKKPR